MFWFRSFALGLLGACCLLLAMRPPVSIITTVIATPPSPPGACAAAPPARTQPDVTVIDVAPGVSSETLAQLIDLAANERIAAVDDVPVPSHTNAHGALELPERQYIDLDIVNASGVSRRVLVLFH